MASRRKHAQRQTIWIAHQHSMQVRGARFHKPIRPSTEKDARRHSTSSQRTGTRAFTDWGVYLRSQDAYQANNSSSIARDSSVALPALKHHWLHLERSVDIPGRSIPISRSYFSSYPRVPPNQQPNVPGKYTYRRRWQADGRLSHTSIARAKLITEALLSNRGRQAAGDPVPGQHGPSNRIDRTCKKLLNSCPAGQTPGDNNNGATISRFRTFLSSAPGAVSGWKKHLQTTYILLPRNVEGTHKHRSGQHRETVRLDARRRCGYALTGSNIGGSGNWIVKPTLVNEAIVGYAL